MNREEAIRWARRSGIKLPEGPYPARGSFTFVELLQFGRRAYDAGAAAEREACVKACQSVIEEIRETADNVLSHEDCRSIQAAQDCAAVIRARSQS
jgi:hypothetical protein